MDRQLLSDKRQNIEKLRTFRNFDTAKLFFNMGD